MRQPVDIDRAHSIAIVKEIGERLGVYFRQEQTLPTQLQEKIDRLRELENAPDR